MDDLQDNVSKWCVDCFGETTAADVEERIYRFIEEALELAQSLGGRGEDMRQLVDYVFNRPKGEPKQEVGGVMITLAALCAANDISMMGAAEEEYKRISCPETMMRIRKKHESKPHRSPLPGDYPQ